MSKLGKRLIQAAKEAREKLKAKSSHSEKDKEPTVIYSDQVKDQMAQHPEIAKHLREFAANARQAMQGVKDGQYKSFDDAMEAITGQRPEPYDGDTEDIDDTDKKTERKH